MYVHMLCKVMVWRQLPDLEVNRLNMEMGQMAFDYKYTELMTPVIRMA